MSTTDQAADARRIEGQGTPESAWRDWLPHAGLAVSSLDALFPLGRRVVVVAPHPDDEVLGCGATLAALRARGREVRVVGVTDGEASHPASRRFTQRTLAATRRDERALGLRALGLDGDSTRLGFLDGGVTHDETALTHALVDLLAPGDIVLATWRLDGHPDHESTGRAAAAAATARGCTLHEMPVWMWHWARPGDPRVPWHRLARLPVAPADLARKRAAIAAHASQLRPDGDAAPILPDWALARTVRPFETFFADPAPTP